MTFLKKALAATAIVALGIAGISALGGATKAAGKFKAAFVYVGPVTDGGWNAAHYEGQLAVEKEFGDKVETVKVENVPESADSERVETQLAQQGANIIFATSFGYMDPTVKVSKAFPKVYFEHCCGYKTTPNMSVYNIRFYESRTVQGTLAGMLTKSGIIGYIASFPIPEVVMGIDAFALALHKVKPDAKIKVVWVNTWYDPGKEADAAKALMDQGADVIAQHTDSPAAVQAAEARGVYSFGEASDMSKFGPTHLVTSEVDNWTVFYVAAVKAAMEGTWKSESTWWGLAKNALIIPDVNKALPADVQAMGAKVREEVRSGARLPFAGPIKDQSGKEILPAGKALDDGAISQINYYVEGVEGEVPK
jgi:simple sugar transport system substrate-binding protein